MKIRVNVRYDERNNRLFYRDFEVVDELPEFDSVKEVSIDVENNSDCYKYDYYDCTVKWFNNYSDEWADEHKFYAVPKQTNKVVTIKNYPSTIEIIASRKVPDPITLSYDTSSFTINKDGLEFEDEFELDEFISEQIIELGNTLNFWLSEDNEIEIEDALRIYLDSRIVESEED